MTFEKKPVADIVRIASAGGGFKLDGSKFILADLVRVAAAAASGKAQLTLVGVSTLIVADIVRIAHAGEGSVIFED